MSELNCSDVDSTITSLGHILNMGTEQVLEACGNQEFIHADPPVGLRSVIWFHATRIPKEESFNHGLLPTPHVRRRLINYLGSLAVNESLYTSEDWDELVVSLDSGALTSEILQWKDSLGMFDDGPHGFLVREVITNRGHIPTANYLKEPEYIRCICETLGEVGGLLLDIYRKSTFPAIVPFRSSQRLRGVITPAMEYVRTKLANGTLHEKCNTGFSAQGSPIVYENLLPIEWLPADKNQV